MDGFHQGDFNITGTWKLYVPVNRERLEQAVQRVVYKDPSLRMMFALNESGETIKTIKPTVDIVLETVLPDKIEIDRKSGQMVRCFLTEDNRLVVSVHHLVADGRSAHDS